MHMLCRTHRLTSTASVKGEASRFSGLQVSLRPVRATIVGTSVAVERMVRLERAFTLDRPWAAVCDRRFDRFRNELRKRGYL